jgi:hypothetical protein
MTQERNMKCGFDGCDRKSVSKGYCDKHYRRVLKRGDVNDYGTRKVDEGNAIERFHKKYEIKPNECWIWTGGTRANSKGVLYPRHHQDDGKSVGAHRFSFFIVNGDIPSGKYICHKCDTPLCVNPNHLFCGTHQDNMYDMVKKNRSYKGRGENKKGRSKLTNNQAEQIRKMEISNVKISKIFEVSQSTISRIKKMESY